MVGGGGSSNPPQNQTQIALFCFILVLHDVVEVGVEKLFVKTTRPVSF